MGGFTQPEMSRQQRIDKIMCKPGYTWNETIKKCLGPAGGMDDRDENGEIKPPPQQNTGITPENSIIPGQIQENPGMAIARQAAMRNTSGYPVQ